MTGGEGLQPPATDGEKLRIRFHDAVPLGRHSFNSLFGLNITRRPMTRRDQMLHDFDRLAAAELDDFAAVEGNEPPRSAAPQPPARLPARRSASRAWDWVLGAGVLGLVMLAARR
jgi:hypothetical protein